MKKLLYVLPVLCAIVLTGCPSQKDPDKGKDPQSGITAVTVKPEKATIAEGANIALTAICTPVSERGEFTWSSSDTTIAAVDQDGNVYGLSAGVAYITAKEKGGLEGKSEIHVTSYLESFSFGQACIYTYNPADTVGAPIEEITSSSGGKYNCYRLPMTLMVFSDGFYINEDRKYDGAEEALVIEMPASMYYAPASINPSLEGGTIFCLGAWAIVKDSSAIYDRVGEPGAYGPGVLTNVLAALDAYNEQNYTDFSAYLKAAGENVEGTTLTNWTYSCDDEGQNCGYATSYVPDAVLEEGYFYLDDDGTAASSYMIPVTYCEFTFRQLATSSMWGVDATHDSENDKIVINDRSKLQLSEPIHEEFGTLPSDAVSKRMIEIPMSAVMTDEARATLDRLMQEGKVRKLNNSQLMHK
jgi:hypothetical protein